MRVKEVIRWGLFLLFAGIAVSIVFWVGSEMIRCMLDQRWADASMRFFHTILLAAFPVIYAILAFQRRWRDLFVPPVLVAGLVLGGILLISPETLGLPHELSNILGSLNERHPWLIVVEIVLFPLVFLKVFSAVIEWFAKTAIRLLARYRTSNES